MVWVTPPRTRKSWGWQVNIDGFGKGTLGDTAGIIGKSIEAFYIVVKGLHVNSSHACELSGPLK